MAVIVVIFKLGLGVLKKLIFPMFLFKVQAKLRESFARLTEALQSREKQLLRQIDVLHSQQIALLQSQHSVPTNCIT
jgi:hypothetical protein